jgi:hypothetical protein
MYDTLGNYFKSQNVRLGNAYLSNIVFTFDTLTLEIHSKDKKMFKINIRILLFSLSTIVTKVASDATHVIKDKVGSSVATTMINEFNREQEEFIKSKSKSRF